MAGAKIREIERRQRAYDASSTEEERKLISREAKKLVQATHGGRTLWRAQQDLFREMERASPEICYDRNMMLSLVSVHGEFLRFCSSDLRNDAQVVLIAAKTDQFILEKASEDLRRDRKFMMKVMLEDGRSLRHASFQLQSDKEVVMAAVKTSARALEYASRSLQADSDVVRAALLRQKEEGEKFNVFRFASPELRCNQDMVLLAYRLSASEYVAREAYQKAHETLQQAVSWKDFLLAAESLLAVPGEPFPTVTVRLLPVHNPNEPSKLSSFLCEAMLMSGYAYSFDVPDTPNLVIGQSSRPTPTAEDLTKLLISKLPLDYRASITQDGIVRIFVVIDKTGVRVTPWDHSRPLTDFL